MTDEIVEEVHAARRKIAEQCDYDFKKLLARYERMQAENPRDLIDEVPKTEPEVQQT
jgi:hypothetical protein